MSRCRACDNPLDRSPRWHRLPNGITEFNDLCNKCLDEVHSAYSDSYQVEAEDEVDEVLRYLSKNTSIPA